MKILVTGTAGFIGFYLAKKLLDRGDEVNRNRQHKQLLRYKSKKVIENIIQVNERKVN